MLANIAVGFLESSSIAKGIEAADAMCKMAAVKLAKTATLARGKYLILITGPVGEVESSLRAGKEILGKTLIDEVLIRNVHQHVVDALDKRRAVDVIGALGIVETKEAISAVLAADAAAKAAAVHVLEVKTVVGGGKGYFTVCGDIGDVRTAVAAAVRVLRPDQIVHHVVIAQADTQLLTAVGK